MSDEPLLDIYGTKSQSPERTISYEKKPLRNG